MLTEDLKTHIISYLKTLDSEFFLVSLKLKKAQSLWVLHVDTDVGISLDDCARIARALGIWFEEQGLVDMEVYGLEVSSPGVGRPLQVQRQYHKNVSRNLHVLTHDGLSYQGRLESVTDTHIELKPYAKKTACEGSGITAFRPNTIYLV